MSPTATAAPSARFADADSARDVADDCARLARALADAARLARSIADRQAADRADDDGSRLRALAGTLDLTVGTAADQYATWSRHADARERHAVREAADADPRVAVRVTSHRARARLFALTGTLRSHRVAGSNSEYYLIDPGQADAAAAITGITRLSRIPV